MSKPKLVITGASGFLGYHLLREASEQYDVYALYHSSKTDFNGATWLKCDIANHIQTGDLLEDIEPDAIIHAAAIADANYCELHPMESRLVNVDATTNLVGIAADFNIPFVFTSTDLVFDGQQGNYSEEDQVCPINVYGMQKVEAEQNVLRIFPESLVVRLPLMFGSIAASSKGNHLAKLISDNRNAKITNLFIDEYRSVAGAFSIAKAILTFMSNANGLLHLGGSTTLSRYEFGMIAADCFKLDKRIIKASTQADFTFAAKRPRDVTFNSQKALSIGFQPLAVNDELQLISNI